MISVRRSGRSSDKVVWLFNGMPTIFSALTFTLVLRHERHLHFEFEHNRMRVLHCDRAAQMIAIFSVSLQLNAIYMHSRKHILILMRVIVPIYSSWKWCRDHQLENDTSNAVPSFSNYLLDRNSNSAGYWCMSVVVRLTSTNSYSQCTVWPLDKKVILRWTLIHTDSLACSLYVLRRKSASDVEHLNNETL